MEKSAEQRTASSNYSSSVYDCFYKYSVLFWTHTHFLPITLPHSLSLPLVFFIFTINGLLLRPRGCAVGPEQNPN